MNDDIDEVLKKMVEDGEIEIFQHVPEIKWRLTPKGMKAAAELIRKASLESGGRP